MVQSLGSLGIPRISWLENLHLQTRSTKEYLFYDTSLNNKIEYAFQALALDEHRSAFSPAVWERPRGNETNLRQVWFPGGRSCFHSETVTVEGTMSRRIFFRKMPFRSVSLIDLSVIEDMLTWKPCSPSKYWRRLSRPRTVKPHIGVDDGECRAFPGLQQRLHFGTV